MLVRLLAAVVVSTLGPQQVFRGGTDVVEVDFIAVDRTGAPVADLRRDELKVSVAGTSRSIDNLTFIRYEPAPTGSSAAVDPVAPALPSHRRVFLVVADETIRRGYERPVIEGMIRLVGQLAADDQIAVIAIPDRATIVEPTSDRSAILQALERVRGHATDQYPAMRRPAMQQLTDAIGAINGDAGPTVLVVVANGLLPSMSPTFQRQLRDLGVQPYELPDARDFQELGRAVAGARAHTYVIRPHNAGTDASSRTGGRAELAEWGLAGLEDMVGITGGEFFQLSGRGDAVFDRVVSETSAYYVATLAVEEADRTGKPRKIEVRVTRPGVTVRARPSFEVPRR